MIEIALDGRIKGRLLHTIVEYKKSGNQIQDGCDPFTFEGLLYYGPLNQGIDGEERRLMISKLFRQTKDEKKAKNNKYTGDYLPKQFFKRLENGEDVRIWCDGERIGQKYCDIGYLLTLLEKYSGKIALQEIPIFEYGTSQIDGSEVTGITDFSPLWNENCNPKWLSEKERIFYIDEWKRMVREGKNLRIFKDNKLVSVDEDYYDEYLFQKVKDGKVDFNGLDDDVLDEINVNYLLHRAILLGIYPER